MIVKTVQREEFSYRITTYCDHIIKISLMNPPRFVNDGTHIEVIKEGRFQRIVGLKNLYELII